MKLLKDYIRKTLAHRHMGSQMVGALALNTVRHFFVTQGRVTRDEWLAIEWYVRFKAMFLKITDQTLKIQIFKQKNQILEAVNLAIAKVGYTTRVEEIRIKT